MKKGSGHRPFIDELIRKVRTLKKIKPGEVHVLSINANYGHYQIIIGPQKDAGTGDKNHRPIEINGEVHHLFVSPKNVSAYPNKHEVMDNLKHTVIMRDLSVHLQDPDGDGEHLATASDGNGLHAREYINMAGHEGEEIIANAEHSNKLSMATYRIIQKDIMNALEKKRE